MEKRNNWFNNYHDGMDGNSGFRKLESRIQYFDVPLFNNATVLDVGCNSGQMMKFSLDNKCKFVTGIEYDSEAVKNCDKYLKNYNNYNSICEDLDNFFIYSQNDNYDIVLFLSVIDTQELKNRTGMLAKIASITNKILYFEGHNGQHYSKYIKMVVQYTSFPFIEYNGETSDNKNITTTRPFITCSKLSLNYEDCIKKIMDLVKNTDNIKIGICGVSGSGKSFIRKKIVNDIFNKNKIVKVPTDNMYIGYIDDLCILDDIPEDIYNRSYKNKFKKIIYFDYRVIEYEKELDYIFFINSVIKTNKLDKSPYLSIDNLNDNLKGIYKVNSYCK